MTHDLAVEKPFWFSSSIIYVSVGLLVLYFGIFYEFTTCRAKILPNLSAL